MYLPRFLAWPGQSLHQQHTLSKLQAFTTLFCVNITCMSLYNNQFSTNLKYEK